jgi:hypothetical protein
VVNTFRYHPAPKLLKGAIKTSVDAILPWCRPWKFAKVRFVIRRPALAVPEAKIKKNDALINKVKKRTDIAILRQYAAFRRNNYNVGVTPKCI